MFIQGGNGWVNSTQNAKLTYAAGDPYEFLGNSLGVTANGNAIIPLNRSRKLHMDRIANRFYGGNSPGLPRSRS